MRPAEAPLLGQGPRAADQSLCVQPMHEAVHGPAPGLLECQHPPLGLDHRGGGEARQQGWLPGHRIDGPDLPLHQLAPALQLRHRLLDLLGPCRAQRHLPGTLLEAPGGERGVTLGEDRCRLAHRAQRRLGCHNTGMRMLPVPLGDTLQCLATLFGFSHEALEIEPVLAGQCPVLAALQDPIDLGLGSARAQGGLLALPGPWRSCPRQPLLGQAGLDGLGPAAEQQGHVARHAIQLEGAVAARHNGVAELGGMGCECLLVALAGLLGVDVEPDALDALPLLLAAAGGVHDHGMAVQLRLGGTRQIVPEHRRHHRAGRAPRPPRRHGVRASQGVLLQPAERFPDRGVVGCDQPLVATDESSQADTLRRGEGQIPAVQMLMLAIPDAAELGLGIDPALEQLLEPAGLDLAGKAQLLGSGTEPV